MDQTGLLARLQSLTADLSPGAAGAEALHQLRRRLVASFRDTEEETPRPSLEPTNNACLETELKLAVAESKEEHVPEGSQLILARRMTPLVGPILSEADHPLAGQSPSRVFGPFADALGRPVWFDEFIVGPTLQIKWAGVPDIMWVLPASLVLPGAQKLQYSNVSIWLAAKALAKSAPPATFAGWKVEQATFEFSAPGTVSGQTLTLPANATCHLTMVPDRSEAPAPLPGPGVDAGDASVLRPDTAELFFDINGLVSLRAGSASLTAFGNAASMVRLNEPPVYDESLARVLIPFVSAAPSLPGLVSKSTLCTLQGRGTIAGAAWSPMPSRTTANQLGDAGSGGALVLTVAGDFTADTSGIEHGPVRLGKSYIVVDRGTLAWFSPAAVQLTAGYALSLWQRSNIRLALDEPFPFILISSRLGAESVQYRGTMSASLDHLKQADGSSLPIRFSKSILSFLQTSAGLSLFGAAADQQRRGRAALALSNGLFTVSPPEQFGLFARLASGGASGSGTMELQMGIFHLLPTLPDPYAANFGSDVRADAPRGLLRARIVWTSDDVQLSFSVETSVRSDGSPVLIPEPLDTPLPNGIAEGMRADFYTFVHQRPVGQRGSRQRNLRLLDVSTNSDQIGVNLSFWEGAGGTIQAEGVDLISLGGPTEVFMLPQIQWEPVRVVQNFNVGTLPDELASPDDGGPALIGARTVRLVPIAPLPVAVAVVDAHNSNAQPTGAFFTLPFGIRALAKLNPQELLFRKPPAINLRKQPFDDAYTAATQIRIEAAPAVHRLQRERAHLVLIQEPPLLPGVAQQLAQASDVFKTSITFPDGTQKPPPFSVLDPLDRDFNGSFGPGGYGVPIERIDLSGYGASCFSNWVNDTVEIGITNVRFEVLVGRTRYEVIRMRSRLIPCDAVVIRTITLERRGSGAVFRWDSGWVAITDGLFDWQKTNVRFHTGAVQGFYNIREIRDTRGTITVGLSEVEVVHFDCDIAIDQVVRGATSGNRVPALNQLGFVQRIPLPFPSIGGDPAPISLLTADELRQLLERFDPVGGNVDCIVNIGASGQEMRVTGVFSAPAPTDGPDFEFAVACYGSVAVPRNEQWTMIRSAVSSGDVVPVDAHRGVPLVRRGGSPKIAATGPYRIAEPQDLVRSNPAVDYGIQLTTRTNRLLFLRPEITPGVNVIAGAVPPVMADPYGLTGVGGAFPPLKRCLHLNLPGYQLDLAPGSYKWVTPPGGIPFTIPDLPTLSRFLVKSGSFDLRVDYAGKLIQIAANTGAPWSINIPKIPAVLDVHTPDLGTDIIKVISDLYSPGAANLTPPEVLFGGALATAKDIITALQAFLPVKGTPPLDIDLSAPRPDDPTLRLRIAANFPICNKDGSAIDIGIGKFRGALGVGTEIQVGLASFGGRIFFSVQGEIQQPLLPKLLYVGGSLFLEVQIDDAGKPGVRLITSAVASIGGDLIPGLVSLEGSVSYGYFLDTTRDPFVPGVALGMEVRAELLSGFLCIRFRVDVAVGVIPLGAFAPGLPRDLLIAGQFTAQVSVVALWVFEKDFSKTFRFEQKVPGLVAGAFAVGTGLLPVPV